MWSLPNWSRPIRARRVRAGGGNILSHAGTALLLAIAGWGAACNFIYADVTVSDQKHYGNTVTVKDIANSGKQYDITNQQVKDGNALNKFTDFGIKQHDVANLHMGEANHQINVVKNKIDIDGVVNAIKNNQIGGDVYFFSNAGIAVGATGVFNVGRLTLGTNAAYGEALYNGGMEKHLAQSAASQAKAVAGGSDITLQGKVYAQSDVVLGAGSVNVTNGEIRTHRNNADTYADKKAAEAYRKQLVNVSPSATVAKALGDGHIALAAVGVSSAEKPFETKGAIVIDKAYMDAAGGDISIASSAERNGGNLMGSKADASVEISNATIQGQNVAISAETKVSGKVGSADAYKTGVEEDGILGLLHETFDEQVGSLASVVKTGADSRVTVKDSKLTAAEDLTISSKATSEIGSETGGALGVGINVGIADVFSKVEIQGTSALTAGKDLAISAEGSNAIDLQRQGSAEDLPIAIDLGWAEAKTDASVTVAKEATLKAKENVDVSAKAERNLSVEVENSSGDGTLGLAVGVIQSETKATADVQGKVYANGKVSVSAENTVSDENGKYDPDTLHITSESESDDGTSSDPIHDIVDVATTKGKGNQLMAGIKKLWGDQSTEKKAADAGTSAADQTASTSAGGGLGLNAATAFLFSDNSAKASLAGEVRGYDGASGASAVDVHAETLSRTKVKAGVSQGADKSAGIAAAVNYVDQNDKAEAELSGDIKSKGNVDVSAETKRPWQSNLEGFGENLADDLKTIFDPNNGFELSYLTDSWTQTGGAGEKVSGAAALNIMEYNHTAKATVKKDTKVEIDNGDLAVSAKNDIHTVNFSGDIKAPIGDQPGSLDFWEDIGGSPFSGGGKAALGGAALTVHQKNTAEATVEDDVTVTKAKDVSVTAENKGSNLSMAAAGGKGQTVAIDGTVNVNRFENTTKATVGKATISSVGDIVVKAEDNTKDINIGGAIAVSGQAGIGATVAYNHIDRQTEASLKGTVTSQKDVSVTAKNTGAIYAMSAAGGITMESSSVNGAGSSGLHAQEGASGSGTSSIGDLAGTLLNAGKSEKDKKSIDSGDSALTNVASQDASMGENVGAAKGGFAAAANVSVNRITDAAKAYTKENAVTADALTIRSGNDSQITTGAGAIALGLSQNSSAIAGSFMYNAITDKNETYAEDAALKLKGSEKEEASLTVEADNAAKITNIAASGSGAAKGSAVAGQISLNWVDNTTDAHVKGGSLKAGKAATISAKDRGTIDSYTGAVAISAGNNGAAVGASIAANLIEGDTKSYLENSEVAGTAEGEKAGKLSVTADETSEIQSIVAAGAGSGKLAAAFAASGNWIHTKTDAHISNANDMKTGALSVLAKNGSNATLGVGSAAAGGNSAGASIGVMVNQSEVAATLTGDKDKNHTITADGITVQADNAYNGAASDKDDKTAKTVAVGFAGGTSQFAGSGSVTVNVIDQKTDVTIGKGKYDAGKKDVHVEARNAAKLFGLAGGVSLSAGSGLGAAVDVQTYKGHTYAGLADGASLTNASSAHVNAESAEHMTSIAATLAGGAGSFAGAGAAGAHSIATDTKAYIGQQSEVTNAGNVSVTAKDETKLTTAAGSGAASGNTGVGLTAAVEVVDKKVSASVGDGANVTGNTLTVKADNTSSSVTVAAGLGAAGTAGLAGAASETFVTHTTDAHVGKNTQVSAVNGVDILADSNFTQGATAGSVGAAGTVGVGISNATVSLHAVTKAYADDSVVISGGNQVKISADHTTDLTYATVAGGVGGTVGVSGNAAVNIIDTETKAYTGERSALSADEAGDGISITASDTTELHGGNGGAAIGISGGGAGVAVGVTNLKKNTSAYAEQNAKLDSKGQVAISAKNTEDIDNVTVQVAGGTYAGLAGAVNVMNLSASTKAYTDTGVQINQANKASGRYGGDISVKADHALKMTSAVGGAAASGGASGGAAVDVANIKTQTNAYIGDSNTIDTKGDVSVSAKDEVTLNSHAYAASIGAVGLSGSISVYSIGSASFDDKDGILTGKNAKGQDEDLTTWVNGQVNQSKTKDAMEAYKAYEGKTGALSDVKKELGTTYESQAPTTEEKGTLAKIGKGTTITADGNVSVDAADTLNMKNYMSSITGSAFASAGASVSVVNTDTQTKALIDSDAKITAGKDKDLAVKSKAAHRMDQIITGASVSGGVSGQGTVATWNDRSDVFALIGASRGIQANNVTVTSDNDRTLEAKVAGASVALGAVNGSVIVANTSGSSTAGVGDESKENTAGEGVTAKEAITISANADTNLDATAIGAAAGVFAGDGTGVRLSSDTDAKAFVGKKEKLKAGRDLSVTAKNTPKISALSTSAAVGLAGVGITVAMASSDDSAHVSVGDGASLTAGKALTIKASMDKPASGSNMEAHAIAGGGGVVSGAVADVRVNLNQHTDVSIGENAALKGKTADISAVHQSASALAMESVAAGYYSGTGGETRFSETSDTRVAVGKGTSIQTTDETRILADNQTEKAEKATSGGAALASGAGIVNETNISHTTNVDLGEVTIHASASDLTDAEKADGKTLYDKQAIAIDAMSQITTNDDNVIATGSAVGAAHVNSEQTVKADTRANVAKGATLLAGDTEEIKKEHSNDNLKNTEDTTYGEDYRGGSIGVGSKNVADLSGSTRVDVFGAAGYAGTSNDVTYTGKTETGFGATAETAKGDICVASGRDSGGDSGRANVSAKSDILNSTAIPISSKKDPYAKVAVDANLSMSGTILSDRDIYLQSTTGDKNAVGSGEVKDWVNKVGEVFGSEGGTIGKSDVTSHAGATIDGKAETGIHRDKSIVISGTDNGGTWNTSVTTKGDIDFTLSKLKASSETLSKRLAELKKELADHISDPAAKASYEAEISFVENKMVEQGLGYRVKDKDGNFTFVEIDPGTKTEYEETKIMLDGMTASKDAVLKAIQKDQAAAKEKQDKMTAMQTTHKAYVDAQTGVKSATNSKNDAEIKFTAAETALKNKIGNNPTQEEIHAYVNDTAHKDIQEVKDYQTTKADYDKAAGVLTKAKAEEEKAKTTYEMAVKTAGYDPAKMDEEKIRADWQELSDLQDAYAKSDKTIEDDIANLTKQVNATENFKAQGGTERDGKFYCADGSEVEGGKWNGETLLHIIAYPHMTRDVTIEDTVSQLGDIYLEGDAITGSGTLTAHGDAKVEVKNESPNNLILGDIKVMGKESNGQIGQGGAFYLNGNAMKGTEQLGNLKLEGRRQTEDPSVTISNTFNPNNYTKDVGEGEKAPVYAAANLQLGKGKTIYNTRGKVTVTSDYGDVYNDGSIVAGSVELTAKNGDFIQSYSNRIANIGGDPFVEDHGGFKENEAQGSGGILANGNIFISARYVNINATIQSGIANWTLEIPENLTFYYKGNDGKPISIRAEEAKTIGKDHTIYVANATGNMAENLTYDAETGRLVLGQTEVHGGKVSIVGTVINTTNDTNKARIEALDGYGSMTIDNKSKLDLELKGLSTGEGVEGVIEITDLDPTKGTPSRKTTYTRKDGKVHMLVQQYQNGSWTSGTENPFDGTYKPSADQHYVFQTGTDKSTTNTYEYHGDKFDWWGIENKTPTRDELIAMGAKLTNTVTGEEKALVNGTFISGSTVPTGGTIGNGETQEWDVLNKSDVIDYSIKTKRRWYTIGLTKKYDMKMVIRDYETHIKQYETGASHAIGIGFGGDENGGNIKINQNGGAGNVSIAGTISNVGGTTAIKGDSITSTSKGFLQTKALDLKATNDVGSKDQAILTSAEEVSGSAKNGNFYLNSSASDLAVGAIEAAKTVSLTSEGSLTQKADAMVKGSRVELTAETGAITGKNGDDFNIQTGQKSGEEYGLKASADGDIVITNKDGNLYLDSVTSKHGDVTLTTDGSFIDNNFGDVTDESAKAKLLAWAKAAVLEGSDATVEKQKTLLKAKVESKYNEYQSLAAYVKDGKYTLDDSAKAALEKKGVTDIDKYIADKQARYDALKDSVGTWTKEGVDAYRESIDNSKKAIYGKASLTKESLTDDTYLTKDEKASILVGSAKSAQDLLVTFSPGGIKEGITDTQATLKETPHVSGQNVKLTALGGKTGENASGIGHKENGQEIDLSAGNLNKLTAQELLALAAAERGDFKVNGNKVTVSSIHSIEANAVGMLTAQADQGAIYLQSAGAVNTGSSLTAAGEVRLKAKGDVNGVTIGSSEQTVIESGAGKISDVTVTGTGVLTARAKDGVSLKKSDGDLVINTVYASEGDVHLDVGENSLLAEDGHDTSGDETGTTYTNVEGENITIANAKNIKGASDGASLGMKVTGTKAEDGSMVPGSIRFHATGDADITLFGEAASDAIDIEAEDLTITSRGNISNGNYQARKALRVHTAQNNTISGGNFSGGTADITNAGKMSGGVYTAKGDLTYTDSENASLSGSDFTSKEGNVKVTAKGQLALKKLSAKESATVKADQDVTLTEAEAGTLVISSDGSVNAGTLTAKTGDASVTAKTDVTIGTLNAKEHAALTSGGAMEVTDATVGSVMANAGSMLHVKKLTSTGEATLTSKDEATLDDVTAGTLAAESKAGSVNAGTLTAASGDAKVTAKTDVTIGTLKAEAGNATIEATDGALGVTTLNAKRLTAKAGTTLSAKTLDVEEHAELLSGGAMTLESASADTLTANAGTTLDATKIHTASDASLVSGSDMVLHEAEAGGKLTTSAGGSISVKGTDAKISGSTIEMTAKEDIRITDRLLVGKLDGVDTSVPAGAVTGSGAAGNLVTGEAKPHDFDASGKGSALLLSAGGKVTLSAKKVEIDTLKNGKGNAADLTISADNIGIDDLAGAGAQHVTIHGKDGQSQAHYAGIHSTSAGGTLVKDSAVEHLELTGREPLGLSNTAIGGDSVLATDKIRVTIQKNPGSSQAEHFGNLSLSGYDIATDHVMTSVKDGLTVNGERFPVTAENVMNASLYEDRTLGRDGREKEEETEKESPSLSFSEPNEKEAYEIVK